MPSVTASPKRSVGGATTMGVPLGLPTMILLGFAYSAVTTCSVHLMTVAFFPEQLLFAERLPFAALNLGFIAVATGAANVSST